MPDNMMRSGGCGSSSGLIFNSFFQFCRRWFDNFVINELEEEIFAVCARFQLKKLSWRYIEN